MQSKAGVSHPVDCFERKQAIVLPESIIDRAALRDLGY
jgi:hypothetical protein